MDVRGRGQPVRLLSLLVDRNGDIYWLRYTPLRRTTAKRGRACAMAVHVACPPRMAMHVHMLMLRVAV